MAAGTVVSRLSGYVRSILLAAALGDLLHADVFNVANTVPNMLYILLAGGVFNAVLVPAAGARGQERRGPGRGLHQPGRHPRRAVPRRRHGAARHRGAAADAAVHRRRLPRRGARGGGRPGPLLPAAGLLLRHVRPGRPDPQLPRPVRPDDVGADRQQRHLGRDAGDLPGRLRRRRPAGRRLHRRPRGAARHRLDPRDRRPAADPGAVPALPPGSSSGRASTSAAPASATPCASAVWTVLFVVVNQIAYTVVVRLASGGTASGGDRRHRHHRLLRRRS